MRTRIGVSVAGLGLGAVFFLSPGAFCRGVGDVLEDVELAGFAQTTATSFDDLVGRAVLLEFFAFW